MKSEKKQGYFLFAPVMLIGIVALLLFESAPLLRSWVWVLGIAASTLLAGYIAYLTHLEILGQKKGVKEAIALKQKEADDLRSVLDETHHLYREKVSKLEDALCKYEREKEERLIEKEKASKELSEQISFYKSRARSFEMSLEEALSELRSLSQLHYMRQQEEVPKNLVKQHTQLREQFEEKSLVLDQTRRRLFEAEGFLLSLKKERGLELLSRNEEHEALVGSIRELIEENEAMEEEIKALEALVAHKFSPTKKAHKKLEQILEFQFETTTLSRE